MDVYVFNREEERARDYYKTQGGLAARVLAETAIIASGHLYDSRVKIDFRNNITAFIESQKDVLDGDTSAAQKLQAMNYLKQEHIYLSDQIFDIKYGRAIKIISISIELISETVGYYVLRGVGIYAGYLQILAGGSLVGASYATGPGAVVGNVAGVALIIHGAGIVQENLWALAKDDRDYIGYLRERYHLAATSLGYTAAAGDILYGGVDLALSGYTLARSVLLPDKGRLYHYMYNDSIRGFKKMAKEGSLKIEMGIDTLTIKNIKDAMNTTPENQFSIPFPINNK